MTDQHGWTETSCEVADLIIQSGQVEVYAGLTDMDGEYGPPQIYYEWGLKPEATRTGAEVPVLRSWSAIGATECRHLVPAGKRLNREATDG